MNPRDTLLRTVARLLWGPGLVVAAGLLVKSYAEVGDGFAAGVVVALVVALSYLALGAAAAERALPFLRLAPALAIGGLVLALVAGFFPLALGEPPFTHRPRPGQEVITIGRLELFTPLLFDLGVFFLVLGVLTLGYHQFAAWEPQTGDSVEPPGSRDGGAPE